MSFIKNAILFLKKLFSRESSIKRIEESTEKKMKSNYKDFENSLKVDITPKKRKKKVETLTCFGDGLGIQTKISF